jgi:hypothetical protein
MDTVTWKEYFELAAALLAFYAIFRVILWWEMGYFRMEDAVRKFFSKRPPEPKHMDLEGHPIDTTQLVERVRDVRQDFSSEAQAHRPGSLNRSALVESRREEIAKLSFFQKPPPELEAPDHEHPSLMLLTL